MKKIFIIFLGLLSFLTLTARAATGIEIAALRTNVQLLDAFRRSCQLDESTTIDEVIDDIKSKRSLNLDNSQISSFKGMPELPNLETLNLKKNLITSFRNMPELANLETLRLGYNPICSFEGMPELPSLRSLALNSTKISNFENMPELPSLTSLNLIKTQISSFEGMRKQPNLRNLNLNHTQIASFEVMSLLPRLEKFDFRYTPLESMATANEVNSELLARIITREEEASNPEIAPLKANIPLLNAFRKLYESGESLSIGAVINLIKTESILNLDDSQISSFKGMPELPDLKTLSLRNTQISSFEGMPELPKLETLNLGRTSISSFEGMPELPNLRELSLNSTRISNFVGMPELAKLTMLNLINAPISSFEGMHELPNLTRLALNKTQIKSFEVMSLLPRLERFDFRHTPLDSTPAADGVMQDLLARKLELNRRDEVTRDLKGLSQDYSSYDTKTGSNDAQTIMTSNSQFGTLLQPSWGSHHFKDARHSCLKAVYAHHREEQIRSFNSGSPEPYFVDLNLVLLRDPNTKWFIEDTIHAPHWDLEWRINEGSIKGQLRLLIGLLFPDATELADMNTNILGLPIIPRHGAFFDRMLTTKEGESDPAAMEQRMYGIILHLFCLYEGKPDYCKKIIKLMSEGNATCPDRLTLSLTNIENEIAFFKCRDEKERLSVAINAYKSEQLLLKIQTNWEADRYGQTDELEDVLYHTLLLKDTLGIKTKTTRMRFENCANEKRPFPYALDQLVRQFNVEDLLYFLQRWLPLQRYYSDGCDRVDEAYTAFYDTHQYDDPDYEANLHDFIKECALKGLRDAGYVVDNPFYSIEGFHQEI